jgi:hypothetical protein
MSAYQHSSTQTKHIHTAIISTILVFVNRSKDNGGVTALKETEYGFITA